MNPAYHGRGLAAEAAEVMLRLGFDGLGLHRIIGRCDGRNIASVLAIVAAPGAAPRGQGSR